MALKLIDGFDQYGVATIWTDPGFWSGGEFGNLMSLVTGRGGVGKAIQPNDINCRIDSVQLGITTDTVILGFWFVFSPQSGSRSIVSLIDSNGAISCSVITTTQGILSVWNGGTQSICNKSLVVGGQYIEVKIKVSDAAGTVDWQINGAAEGSDTGLDTRGGTVTDTDKIRLFKALPTFFGVASCSVDDLYVADTVGSDLVDFAGDAQVNTRMMATETATINFTPSTGTDNAANVDEIGPDYDGTYNESSTVTDDDMFDVDDVAVTGDTVLALMPFVLAKKVSAGGRGIGVKVERGGTESTPADQALATDEEYFWEILENDPNGGAAFTVSNANVATVGYEVTS